MLMQSQWYIRNFLGNMISTHSTSQTCNPERGDLLRSKSILRLNPPVGKKDGHSELQTINKFAKERLVDGLLFKVILVLKLDTPADLQCPSSKRMVLVLWNACQIMQKRLAKLQDKIMSLRRSCTIGYLFSQATAEIPMSSKLKIRNQGCLCYGSCAWILHVKGTAGIVSADGVFFVEPMMRAILLSVQLFTAEDLTHVYADESYTSLRSTIGLDVKTTRFSMQSSSISEYGNLSSLLATCNRDKMILKIKRTNAEGIVVRNKGKDVCTGHRQEGGQMLRMRVVKALYGTSSSTRAWYARFLLFCYNTITEKVLMKGDLNECMGEMDFLLSLQVKSVPDGSFYQSRQSTLKICLLSSTWICKNCKSTTLLKLLRPNSKVEMIHQLIHSSYSTDFSSECSQKILQVSKGQPKSLVVDVNFLGEGLILIGSARSRLLWYSSTEAEYVRCLLAVVAQLSLLQQVVSAGSSLFLLVVILPAASLVSAVIPSAWTNGFRGWSMVLLCSYLSAARLFLLGWSMVLLGSYLSCCTDCFLWVVLWFCFGSLFFRGRMVSAGWSMVLLVVIFPAARLVSAGWSMVLCYGLCCGRFHFCDRVFVTAVYHGVCCWLTLSAAIVTWFLLIVSYHDVGTNCICCLSVCCCTPVHKDDPQPNDYLRLFYFGGKDVPWISQISSAFGHSPLRATILPQWKISGAYILHCLTIKAGKGMIAYVKATRPNFYVLTVSTNVVAMRTADPKSPRPTFGFTRKLFSNMKLKWEGEAISLTPPMLAIAAAGNDAADEETVPAHAVAGSIISIQWEDETILGGFNDETHAGPDDAHTPQRCAGLGQRIPALFTSSICKD
ncbi:hypothetical protein Tco_1272626 [Tanacetum coccineum]